MSCNNACIAAGRAEITAIPINCTSKCPHYLSGGNGIVIGKGFTPVVNEIYVSRFVVSISNVRTRLRSGIALINASNNLALSVRRISRTTCSFGCRLPYHVTEEIPHACCDNNGLGFTAGCVCKRWG